MSENDPTQPGGEAPLLIEKRDDHIAVITLNRPAKRNAVTGDMAERLVELLEQIRRDDGVRAAVLTGCRAVWPRHAQACERTRSDAPTPAPAGPAVRPAGAE